ncbi:hypothetical protein ADIWIN_1367 [Winogradskyella psychrotolerans RS-3]|uniref:DUF1572 domain-containing protein n=1 Tax=Winogradskyella psychrotolerans RS-3 TaxID=641526 RepID=S7VU12_9FLAO|nr:DUF1572 family protein [Winogradskyella psychrotolerans]EPR73730.1 hypothetical protein ADIWIN_1367 [Winogradskyella psychrotolerans RS-3]
MDQSYLPSVIKQFEYYKSLGDKTIAQLSFNDLQKEFAQDSNSVAIIVKHLVGNMLSRWTNFLTEDGEKVWRQRDDEFNDDFKSKDELLANWNKGWDCLFIALKPLKSSDLDKAVYIRNQGHSLTEAINRQMMHYAYHVGQIVFIGKFIKGAKWQSLSIAKGQSKIYNTDKFQQDKRRTHFTDEL